MGTLNILEALKRYNNKCAAVIITSDKCYENLDNIIDYAEGDRLGGIDPYSTSKASAELIFNGYKNSFFMRDNSNVKACTTRAGNVIGGGDWALNRIVPDCFRSWSKQEEVIIRNPEATRPWQHVLDPLNGYLTLACNLADNKELNGEAFNFGPETSYSVSTLVENLSNYYDGSRWNIEKEANRPHESKLLSLNCEKSHKILNIRQKIGFEMMSEWTSTWYKNFYNKNKISTTTVNQIEEFMNLD
jgi:CDP-glucose 4,6-dehydratase